MFWKYTKHFTKKYIFFLVFQDCFESVVSIFFKIYKNVCTMPKKFIIYAIYFNKKKKKIGIIGDI